MAKRRKSSIKNRKWYNAIQRSGLSRGAAAAISNAMAQGKKRRSAMARKAARTRKRKKG